MAYTTINKSTDYFNTKLYTGNGGTQSITGVGFQPDMVWTKQRNAVRNHVLFDAVRGATKGVKPNESQAEFTWTNSVTSFDTNGFSVGGAGEVNYSSGSMASWNWKANGQGSSNTVGTINTTYTSANTTAGFSIVKYTGNQTSGATVGHGLGAVPAMFMVKNLNDAESWQVYHKDLTSASYHLVLNDTSAQASNTSRWNGVAPTNQVFTLGNNDTVNNVNIPYIAYCFAEKTGYSKFGSYIGNGNADGTFIYTGFKPAFFMAKRTSASGDPWVLIDNKRNTFNALSNTLTPSDSNAENTGTDRADFLSNGIKIKTTSDAWNGSGSSYIYMAFADAPLVGSNNVPCTAR